MNNHLPLITLLLLFSLTGGLFTSKELPASQEVGRGAVHGVPVPAAPSPDCGCIEEALPLSVHSEGYPGVWPPCVGRKLIAHMNVRNKCGYDVQVKWLGARGRRSGDTEYWDMLYENIEIPAGGTWVFDPNNERPLDAGWYSLRMTCSPDGSAWREFGTQLDFQASWLCVPTSTPVAATTTPTTPPVTPSPTSQFMLYLPAILKP